MNEATKKHLSDLEKELEELRAAIAYREQILSDMKQYIPQTT